MLCISLHPLPVHWSHIGAIVLLIGSITLESQHPPIIYENLFMWRQIRVSFLKHCPQMYTGSSENNHLGRVNPLSCLVTPPPPPPPNNRHYTHDVRQLNSPIYTFNTFYESPSKKQWHHTLSGKCPNHYWWFRLLLVSSWLLLTS